ncbi:MAG: DUF3311 domain-containing protein [Mycobacterium leprae]
MARNTLVALIVLVPYLAQLVAIPWVNRIQPLILGIPFFHCWLFVWMLLTPLFTVAVHRILRPDREE